MATLWRLSYRLQVIPDKTLTPGVAPRPAACAPELARESHRSRLLTRQGCARECTPLTSALPQGRTARDPEDARIRLYYRLVVLGNNSGPWLGQCRICSLELRSQLPNLLPLPVLRLSWARRHRHRRSTHGWPRLWPDLWYDLGGHVSHCHARHRWVAADLHLRQVAHLPR